MPVMLPPPANDIAGSRVAMGAWGWVREEVTANACFGTRAKIQQQVSQFFRDIARRTDEVKRGCRRTLQAQADALTPAIDAFLHQPSHVDPTVAWV